MINYARKYFGCEITKCVAMPQKRTRYQPSFPGVPCVSAKMALDKETDSRETTGSSISLD
jgi:hypothetical protein